MTANSKQKSSLFFWRDCSNYYSWAFIFVVVDHWFVLQILVISWCSADEDRLHAAGLGEVSSRGVTESPQFQMGVCCWAPENLTLFQTKEAQLCYPVPDKMVKIDTLFQTEKRKTLLTFDSEMACLSKHAAGPEREQRQRSFAAWFWQKKSNPTMSQSHMKKRRPCSRQKCWFVDPVPDSERQKPYPVEWHIPV